MTRHLLFAFIIFLLSATANAQTNVSGNITTDVTWTKANSPYRLTGNVGIPAPYKLTIEPGVVVQRVSADYEILITGTLQCEGTEQDSIFFLSSDITTLRPVGFVVFRKSNLSGSTVRFTSFSSVNSTYTNDLQLGNEDGNSQTGPRDTGTLLVSRCHLNGTVLASDYNSPGRLVIDSSSITSAFVNNQSNNGVRIVISNSRILYSTIANSSGTPNTDIMNCRADSSSFFLSGGNFNSVIDSSAFTNCFIGANPFNGRVVQITNSTFLNSHVFSYNSTLTVANSKFTATARLYVPDTTVYIRTENMLEGNELVVRDCEFANESPYNTTGIYINGYSQPNNNTINHNRFSNLNNGVAVYKFTTMQLDSNDFYSPAKYDIVNISPDDFSALYNYYQLTAGQTIDDLIFDQNDDLNYGLVLYTPYASNPNTFALPVTLTHFTGGKDGNTIKLNWQTGSEVNASDFVVQRKAGNGFADIGTVKASGANTGASYSFTDASPLNGANEYRLKITDRDGRYAYSNIVSIKYDALVKAWRVYPNPASSYIVIEYNAANGGAQMQLINAGGSVIKAVTVATGSTQVKMPVSDVARGMYKVIIRTGSVTESRTVLIQ